MFDLVHGKKDSQMSAPTSEMLFLLREHKIHMFELSCNVLFIIYINNKITRGVDKRLPELRT